MTALNKQAQRIPDRGEVLDLFLRGMEAVNFNRSKPVLISLLKEMLPLLDELKALQSFRTAYMEWSDKTDWVQTDKRLDVIKPWGKHRADVLKLYIEHLESNLEAAKHTAAVDHEAACSLVEENEEVKRKLEAAEKRITELLSENAGLKNSVENAAGCINAAYSEGLIDVLSESSDERLVDLVKRRLLFSYLPVETPATNEELIAMGDWVLREQLEDGTRAIKTLNRRIAELEARAFNPAILDVIAERQRQKAVEGWTPEHDDEHCNGELAMAAVCYINETGTVNRNGGKPWGWPWEASWWKPKGRRRNLVKAGALILAEIERIDRAAGIGKGE